MNMSTSYSTINASMQAQFSCRIPIAAEQVSTNGQEKMYIPFALYVRVSVKTHPFQYTLERSGDLLNRRIFTS